MQQVRSMYKKVAQRDDKEVESMFKKYRIIVYFSTGEKTMVAKTKYEGYAKLLAKWLDDYYRLKDVKAKVKIRHLNLAKLKFGQRKSNQKLKIYRK